MKETKVNPGDILKEGALTFEEKNAEYGNTYMNHGYVMAALFPNGVKLNSIEDHIRFGIFNMQVSKICRYAMNFNIGGHEDSVHDLMVYSAMLKSVDLEMKRHQGMLNHIKDQMNPEDIPVQRMKVDAQPGPIQQTDPLVDGG